MTDIDMFAHMQNVFSPIDRDKPNLPFSEFIVDAGEHVSVISGNMFYCRPDAPYEVRVIGMNDDEPRGYQTDEDLMILLAKLVAQGDTDGI
jgi:hypothetical protein